MNLLIVTLNAALASIAALLCVIGWRTLKATKHLKVGKPFWIPIIVSGLFFLAASITSALNEVVFALTNLNEIVQITQLIALCFISIGIYGYSNRIRKNLALKITMPKLGSIPNNKIEDSVVLEPISTPNVEIEDKPVPSPYDTKGLVTQNNLIIEVPSKCNHQLGYLHTFPITASLPEECLSCEKVIECKTMRN